MRKLADAKSHESVRMQVFLDLRHENAEKSIDSDHNGTISSIPTNQCLAASNHLRATSLSGVLTRQKKYAFCQAFALAQKLIYPWSQSFGETPFCSNWKNKEASDSG